MFPSFRHRLLFWFLVFISSNVLVIWLAGQYFQSREKISLVTRIADQAFITLLQTTAAQHDFFTYDTRNPEFFITGVSPVVARYDSLHRVLMAALPFGDRESGLQKLDSLLQTRDSLFHAEVQLVRHRGYKDHQLEGSMRRHIHWLESHSSFPLDQILTLRRHEKDYIIRNEMDYVERLNKLGEVMTQPAQAPRRQDSSRYHLTGYLKDFNAMVALDRQIGIKDNSGLKQQIDRLAREAAHQFAQYQQRIQAEQARLFFELNLGFLVITIALLILSIALSFLMANRITKPLTDLTGYITRFVDSNFTIEDGNPTIRSRDEIGKLTRNFTVLKTEVINRLRFFKQKVDERTAELAEANARLSLLNEANSRFVPKEFLHYLEKSGIEAIALGDHAEREMTVMFTDIRAFTRYSEQLSPEQTFEFLNNYLSRIVPVILRHGGFIDKFIGDSVMALFPSSSTQAISAACELVEVVNQFNAEGKYEPISIGTGIHRGNLILGTIGHQDRLETTVISDAVNIASRAEGLTKHYLCSILVTREVLHDIDQIPHVRFRFLDTVKVKGKNNHIEVYEILPPADKIKLGYLDRYEAGLSCLKEHKLEAAKEIFRELRQANPADGAVEHLLKRCEEFLTHGYPADWDGVVVMQTK